MQQVNDTLFMTPDCPMEGLFGHLTDCQECPDGAYCPGTISISINTIIAVLSLSYCYNSEFIVAVLFLFASDLMGL